MKLQHTKFLLIAAICCFAFSPAAYARAPKVKLCAKYCLLLKSLSEQGLNDLDTSLVGMFRNHSFQPVDKAMIKRVNPVRVSVNDDRKARYVDTVFEDPASYSSLTITLVDQSIDGDNYQIYISVQNAKGVGLNLMVVDYVSLSDGEAYLSSYVDGRRLVWVYRSSSALGVPCLWKLPLVECCR